MSSPDEIREDLPPDLDSSERDVLVALALQLRDRRPPPAAGFRGELRRRLSGGGGERGAAPASLRSMVLGYVSVGTLLLAFAAAGLAGAGPFAA